MKLPNAPSQYDPAYQTRVNAALENEDRRNRKTGVNIELVQECLILRSPNGTRFKLTVSNAGVLSAMAL